MPEMDLTEDLRTQIEQALDDKELDNVYLNGFVNVLGSGDVMIVLKRNNRPVAILSTSYTVAKTLAQKLAQLIENLERKSGNVIMTTDDVQSSLVKEENVEISE